MQHLGAWFSNGLGCVRLMVALDDLKGFSNLKDSTILVFLLFSYLFFKEQIF